MSLYIAIGTRVMKESPLEKHCCVSPFELRVLLWPSLLRRGAKCSGLVNAEQVGT